MAAAIDALDWSATPLGPRDSWPQSLQAAVRLMLCSRYMMFIWWGKALTCLYNDTYIEGLGPRHPAALGQSGRDIWHELWDVVGPQVESVMHRGESTFNDRVLLVMQRKGFAEETYFTFSYSPAFDDAGNVGGLFCVCTEETGRVLGERRLQSLRALSIATVDSRSAATTCQRAAQALAANDRDLPFVLLYLLDGNEARLVAQTGIEPGAACAPLIVDMRRGDTTWPFAAALEAAAPQLVLPLPFDQPVVDLAVPEPVQQAIVLPIAGQGSSGSGVQTIGFMVAAISPRLIFNGEYGDYLALVAQQIAGAIAEARAFDAERQRALDLAALDRSKTAFFSNVSHEFRTPLTLLLGPLEDLAFGHEVLETSVRERIVMAQRNGQRLLRLVNSLLDFARIEAGRVQTSFEPVDLATATAELASVFQSVVDKAGMRLVIECNPLPEPVYIDRGMWEKIVLNLLSNAFKFTLNGTISVALEQQDREAVLSVTDTGVGIPEAELGKIFDRFHRVEGSLGRSHEGTGIGLALVKELAELNGGSVNVQSTAGSGSRFEVRLPLGRDHLPADHVRTGVALDSSARPMGLVEEAMQFLISGGDADLPETTPAALGFDARQQATTRATVLVVDDSADMRRYVSRLLAGKFDVLEAADGAEALRMAQEMRPDLILADVMMPVLDGFQLVKALHADPETASIPTIMLSARAGEESQIDGLRAGADDYLVKPFSARELIARVSARIELAAMRRETDAHITTTLESITDGLLTFDTEWRYTYANGEALRMIGRPREEVIGRCLWDLFPEALGTSVEVTLRRVAQTGEPGEFEGCFPSIGRWYHNKAYPGADGGVTVFFDDITERRVAQQALAESERHKDEFLATLAHELRNPLAPLRTGLDILVRSRNKPDTFNKTSELMQRQLQHMVRLIDELLDLSRVSRGVIELKNERLDVATLVQQALEMARPLLDERQHTLRITMPGGHVQVMGDAVRLCQILVNLLNNAFKYTDPHGTVTLIVEAHENEVCMAVVDNGMGISKEALPRVFDMFSQVSRSLNTTRGGLGIGLALARQLAQLHGGRIEAESEGLGKGSKFVFWLPKAEVDEQAVATAYDELPADQAERPLRILVCDDNQDAATLLTALLDMLGHEVVTTYDGESAVEQVAKGKPELVFLDIGMPGMDGYETCQRIRSLAGSSSLTIVALTGWGNDDVQERCRQAGFSTHVLKPASVERLEEIIAAVPVSHSEA